MNFGGDPGQDDYGLPPVDIEIPDDARDLDRDVQAYHRELRMLRRQRLLRRLHEPLTRDGMVLPLLAGCLALTLLAGTLLTVFTGGQGAFVPPPRAGSSPLRKPVLPGQVGGSLPDTLVLYDGQKTPVLYLHQSVLALVPGNCQCQSELGYLSARVSGNNFSLYVVGADDATAVRLARQVGLPARSALVDVGNGLATVFRPAGLTAVFVGADDTVVAIVRGVRGGVLSKSAIGAGLRAMSPPNQEISPRNPPSPGGTGSAAPALPSATARS